MKQAFSKEPAVEISDVFTKEFKIKQFADVIESLTAAVFTKCGLHGAQVFLKSIGVLNQNGYDSWFYRLMQDLMEQDLEDYKNNFEIRKIEKRMKYNFEIKKLLLIAVTHKSHNKHILK